VVYGKPTVQGPEQVLQYRGRYVHRIALTKNRILSSADGPGCWRAQDAQTARWHTMTLSAQEFIRRFLPHVFPQGFHKVRDDGLWSPIRGDITKPKWRESQHELEEMFLVPLPAMQMPNDADLREGMLIGNGHINPYVEPAMEGWFQEQKQAHGRTIKFTSLDHLVQWIVNEGLINDFRAALAELGLRPVI
jgi:hypothetical protein